MKIEIYSKSNCSYCEQAKNLLTLKQVDYVLYQLGVDFDLLQLKQTYPQAKTFPVIIIDDVFVGGYTQLQKLFKSL